jgi:hypothetical protein
MIKDRIEAKYVAEKKYTMHNFVRKWKENSRL